MSNNTSEKINKTTASITKTLKKSNIYVFLAGMFTVISLILVYFNNRNMGKEILKNVLVIGTNGEKIDTKIISLEESVKIQKIAFITNFVELCYGYDYNNMEERLLRAAQLGDQSLLIFLQKNKKNNLYMEVAQLKQSFVVDRSQIVKNLKIENGAFVCTFTQLNEDTKTTKTITIQGEVKKRSLDSENLLFASDNPFGLIITNFKER